MNGRFTEKAKSALNASLSAASATTMFAYEIMRQNKIK